MRFISPCFFLVLTSLTGCVQSSSSSVSSASGHSQTTVHLNGMTVRAVDCSVTTEQTLLSKRVVCTCNGVQVDPVHDDAHGDWLCQPP